MRQQAGSGDGSGALGSAIPGQSRIAFSRWVEEQGEQVFTMDVDGGDVRQLTGGGKGRGHSWGPAWSPDGAHICFTSARECYARLHVMKADGTDRRQLTLDCEGDDDAPAWSPDGTRIAFGRGDRHPDDLYLLDIASGSIRPLTTSAQQDSAPSWSPDGALLAFRRSYGMPPGLYVMPAAGGEARFLTPGLHPAWSPHGGRIAFALGNALWLLAVDARGAPAGRAWQVVCSPEMMVRRSSWSPEGDALVFGAQITDATGVRDRLMVVTIDGGEPRDLGPGSGPAWSPPLP